MNVKRARYIYLGLIAVFLGVIIASVYYMLGGFESVSVYRLEPKARVVAGRYFSGYYNDEAPREFGMHCRELIESHQMEGTLTTINYKHDTLAQKEVSLFVGITLEGEMAEIPQGFEVREFTPAACYAVFLSMHVLVQPRPHQVEDMLSKAAQAQGDVLEDFFFELRYPDNSLSVEARVKK